MSPPRRRWILERQGVCDRLRLFTHGVPATVAAKTLEYVYATRHPTGVSSFAKYSDPGILGCKGGGECGEMRIFEPQRRATCIVCHYVIVQYYSSFSSRNAALVIFLVRGTELLEEKMRNGMSG